MIDSLISSSVWLGALIIFALRVGDMALDTIRVLFVVRGRKGLAWVLGFFQALIFVVAISGVLANANNIWNILAYAGGFATGNVIGMLIEERLAIGFIRVTIISSIRGAVITEKLRAAGYAVTEIPARGRDGTVSMLQLSVRRKEVPEVETIALEADAESFVTSEDVRPLRRGFWRA